MSEPQPPPPEKKSFVWPLAVNLSLLVVAALFTGANPTGMAIAVGLLFAINIVAAIIMGIAGSMDYVLAFALAALLVLLIGAGICALMLSNMGGMH